MARPAHIVFCVLAFGSVVFGQQDRTAPWQEVAIAQTDTERALYLFGIPDSVRADMTWAEYLTFERSPKSLSGVCFIYLPLRSIPVLVGPLGTATSAQVCFQSNRVSSIEWSYSSDRMAHAHAAWLQDAGSERRLAGRVQISSKQVKNGTLFVLCGVGTSPPACEGEITARLQSADKR